MRFLFQAIRLMSLVSKVRRSPIGIGNSGYIQYDSKMNIKLTVITVVLRF